jgi:hypothetical protein
MYPSLIILPGLQVALHAGDLCRNIVAFQRILTLCHQPNTQETKVRKKAQDRQPLPIR